MGFKTATVKTVLKSEVILTSPDCFKGQLWFRIKIMFSISLIIGYRLRLGLEDGE